MHIEIFTDGGSRGNPGQAAVGVVVLSGQETIHEVGKTIGIATNNEAEYQAILLSLEWLSAAQATLDIEKITWKLDSKLVVEQLNKNWKVKEPRMLEFAKKAWMSLATLPCPYQVIHIPREQNAAADALVNQALDAAL